MFTSLMVVLISPEKWIELLRLYGPMALFVFMVFVLRRIAQPTAGLNKEQKKVQILAYLLVWISIFALAVMIVVAWWKVNFPREYMISGTITNLTSPQIVTTEQELYLHKRPVAGLDFDYDWRLISPQRFTGTIELLLQKKPSDVTVLKYKLPIPKEFYDSAVEVEYDQTNDQMNVRYGNSQSVIKPSPASIAADHHSTISDPQIVYAESRPQASPGDLILALDADDPLIRQSARRDLVKLSSTALPDLSQALINPQSSYRLRVGLLAVLQEMGASTIQNLNEAGRCAVLKASNDSDPTIREEAKAILATGVKVPSSCSSGMSVPDGTRATLVKFHKIGWRPADLTSNPGSGMFVLDDDGEISRLVADEKLPRIEELFDLKEGGRSGIALTANADSVFVLSSKLGCTLYKYSLTSKVVSQRNLAIHEACTGIATNGNVLYVAFPDQHEIRYWNSWDAPTLDSWSFAKADSPGYLVFDSIGNQLIALNTSGKAYAISVSDGKAQLLASNLGVAQSITTSRFHIVVASGKKVVFLARSDNHRENLPTGLQALTGGRIVGVTVDKSDNLWFADYDKKVVEGPYPLI